MIQRVKTDYRYIYFDAVSTLGLATGSSFRHGSYVPIILCAFPYFVTQKDVLGSSHTSPVPGPEQPLLPGAHSLHLRDGSRNQDRSGVPGWLAWSVEHAILDLGIVSSSPPQQLYL